MERLKRYSWFVLFVVVAAGCDKSSPVTLTTEEQLAFDINLIDEYLATNGINAVKLDNGLRYVITATGSGPMPTKDNCITFFYAGTVLNAEEGFETSDDGGYKAPLKSQIMGIQIIMKLLSVGSKATVFIPSQLGYAGEARTGIPANSVLKFDVELLQISNYNAAGNYCY